LANVQYEYDADGSKHLGIYNRPFVTPESADIYVEDILKAERKDVAFRARRKPNDPSISIPDFKPGDLWHL